MDDETKRRDVEQGWAERGWPAALLVHARRLHISEELILRWFGWNAPLTRAEEEVGWAERLQNGSIRFRQLTFADNESFCALWANSPEQIGDWDVAVERGPNGFASFELQERPALNGLFDDGVMVACVSFSLRHTFVAGQRISVRFGQAMRVHSGHRGQSYAHWVRSLPWAIGLNMPTRVQYDYIRARNMAMERWNEKFMPSVDSVPKRPNEVPGIATTVLQFPATAAIGATTGVRPARRADFGHCAELINRTHAGRDLFVAYTPEKLTDRLEFDVPPGAVWSASYGIEDFWVLERGGSIVACAGLWDRGRDIREYWRHRESGQERTVAGTALLDLGCAEGAEEDLAYLIEHCIGRTNELGRDILVAPLETLPEIASRLSKYEPATETRYLQWRSDSPALATPAHLDLRYW